MGMVTPCFIGRCFLLAKIAEQCKKVLRGAMPDRDASTIRDPIYYQHATIIAKSAFAASDGVQGPYAFYRLKHRGDKKFYDPIPPIRSGTLDTGDVDADEAITVRDIDWVLGSGGGRFNGGQ